MNMRTVVVIEYQKKEQRKDHNTMMSEKIKRYRQIDMDTRYIVKNYHLNYPTDYEGE
jgi:hypothetical protein